MKRFTAILLALVLSFVGIGAVHARGEGQHQDHGHHRGHGKGFGMFRVLDRLDLTSEQKKEVASILQAHRAEMDSLAKETVAAKTALYKLVASDEIPEAELQPAVQAVAQQHEKMIMLHIQIMNEVKENLTVEQKEVLKQFQNKRLAMMENHSERLFEAVDKWIAAQNK